MPCLLERLFQMRYYLLLLKFTERNLLIPKEKALPLAHSHPTRSNLRRHNSTITIHCGPETSLKFKD